MITDREPVMGRFSIEVDVANNDDEILASNGVIPPEQVRRARVRGVVDSGATRLVIPASLAQQLGLKISETAKVRYDNEHTAERDIARGVHLTYGGRDSVFNAIVEPDRVSILVGAIVMEDLDFLVDRTGQRLVPRDPKQIVSEAE